MYNVKNAQNSENKRWIENQIWKKNLQLHAQFNRYHFIFEFYFLHSKHWITCNKWFSNVVQNAEKIDFWILISNFFSVWSFWLFHWWKIDSSLIILIGSHLNLDCTNAERKNSTEILNWICQSDKSKLVTCMKTLAFMTQIWCISD